MQSTLHLPRRRPLALLVALLASLCSAHHAQTRTYGVSMDGAQSGVATAGSGFATITLDTSSGALSLSGSYSGLNANQSVAHIHGPAPIGQGAGVVLGLTGSGGTSGTLTGAGTLSAQQIQDLEDGLHYINVHSSAHPAGEIRGQIVQQLNLSCAAQLGTDPLLSDVGGNPAIGPHIDSTSEPFNLALDCTGAGTSSLFLIQLHLQKSSTPILGNLGNLWVSGPSLFKCLGNHTQNVVRCSPGNGIRLPNDPSLVGLSYTAQGFCGDPSARGRLSNGLVQWIGL